MVDQAGGKLIAAVLRRLAREMDDLTEDELRELVVRKGRILEARPINAHADTKDSSGDLFDPAGMVRQLREMKDRDSGESFLRSTGSTRSKLLRLGRELDLPISNKNTVQEMIERIVEATIGFRLRSAAIRGHNLESTNPANADASDGPNEQIAPNEQTRSKES